MTRWCLLRRLEPVAVVAYGGTIARWLVGVAAAVFTG